MWIDDKGVRLGLTCTSDFGLEVSVETHEVS